MSISNLFPSSVVTVEGSPEDFQEPAHPEELNCVEKAVDKRKREFVAGRNCARRALRELSIADVAILAGDGREPIWPDGIVGSISHTQGYCGAAVARAEQVRGLGLDVEHIRDTHEKLWPEIVSETELASLERDMPGDRARVVALAFSCKEAFYKCQYPLTRQWVGLLDADVCLNAGAGTFRIVPRIAVDGMCRQGTSINGRYVFQGDYVMTGIELGRS